MTDCLYSDGAYSLKEIATPETLPPNVTLGNFSGFDAPDVFAEHFSSSGKTTLDNINSTILTAMRRAKHRRDLEEVQRLDELYDTVQQLMVDMADLPQDR